MRAAPRSHADPAVLAAKRARLDQPHVAPLKALAAQVERTTRRPTPRVDPDSGGTRARVLLLLETPSAAAACGSGIVSIDDDDARAANLWRALGAAGLDRHRVVLWNVVPWFVGASERGASPSAGELQLGRAWLAALLPLLPRLVVVVALGASAHAAVAPLNLPAEGVTVLLAPHPGQRVSSGPGSGGPDRLDAALAQAAEVVRTCEDR